MLILGIVISIAGSTLNMTIKEKSDLFSGSIFSRFSLRKKRPLAPSSEDGIPHIPQFEIVGMLGEGGMASVYLCKQVSTGREVAIKILATHLQSDSLWASRFLDEATRLAELVALAESKRTESYWIRSKIYDATGETLKAEMLLNHATLKGSYPGYGE